LEEALAHDHSSLNDTAISAKIGCRDCCGAGSLELSITANGDIFPCHMFFEEKFLLGNALTDCLDTVFLDQRPMFDVDRKNECQKCEYRYICGGGCLYRSFAVRGHLEDTDPLCPINASHIKQALSGLIG
jgi:radical SAM protein with 4Fe4S-binding SPASM domain